MKKMMKRLAVLVVALALLTAVAIPALADGFDFAPAIEEFESTPLNTTSLAVGQTHLPGGGVWAQSGWATCYSSDEAVVTVSADGLVTAVGEGTAYVAIDVGAMYDMFCYHVIAQPQSSSAGNGDSQQFAEDFYNRYEQFREEVEAKQEEAKAKNEALLEAFENRQKENKEVLRNLAGIGAIVLAVLLLAGRIVGLVIVCKKAPGADMSKAWALLSLISVAFAVVLIIIMSKNSKQKPGKGKVVCPVCNTIHSENTTRCNVCGATFQ